MVADYACAVGENPLWHVKGRHLLWTDITRGRLFRFDPALNQHEPFCEGRPIGGFTIQEDGSLLLFKDRGTITCWNNGQEVTLIEDIAEEKELRFNDVISDPAGRVFCGTYTDGKLGRLYRLDKDGTLTRLIDKVGCSNGMAFTLDCKKLFYIDSLARSIYQFDYDAADGAIGNQQVFYSVPESYGLPDGCTVDSEDHLWVAFWDGSAIRRLDPTGRVESTIEIPARKVTSLTFAGPHCKDIYVTSGGGENRSEGDPMAGALFRLQCSVRGRLEYLSKIKVPNATT